MLCAWLKVTLKIVNQITWRVSQNVSIYLAHSFRVMCSLCVRDSFTKFPICLSIKLVSSDEYRTAFLSCVEQNKISWYPFIMMYFDYLTDFHVSRFHMCIVALISQAPIKLLQLHCFTRIVYY